MVFIVGDDFGVWDGVFGVKFYMMFEDIVFGIFLVVNMILIM